MSVTIGPNGVGKTTLLRAIMGVVDREVTAMTFDAQGIRADEAVRKAYLG